MISIQEAVGALVLKDEEALTALERGYMSQSKYARRIKKRVESLAKKNASVAAISISLSRIKKTVRATHPLVRDIHIRNIFTRAPLAEIAYEKTSESLQSLFALITNLKVAPDDYLTTIVNARDITIITSERLVERVTSHFEAAPHLCETKLAAIGIGIDPELFYEPNITYSLQRRIASRHITLSEIVTAHREITFIFHSRHLAEVLSLFEVSQE